MKLFDVYTFFKEAIALQKLKMLASVTEKILPYEAQFVADPFIWFERGVFHIFCEVFVSQEDKRIAHLKSKGSPDNWMWVSDVITGLDLSFPAIYEPDQKKPGEVLLIPQISKSNRLIAYRYNLQSGGKAEIAWDIELGKHTHDRIIVKNPVSSKAYLLYCAHSRPRLLGLTGLYVCEIHHPFDREISPVLGASKKVIGKSPGELILKILKKSRLSYRPAGNVIRNNKEFFTLPVQAKKAGKYGELIAFVSIYWDSFTVKETTFFNSCDLSDNIERFHHLSWTQSEKGDVVFCHDLIRPGNREDWEIAVFQAY